MNLLNNGNEKKKWIIISIVAVLLVIITLTLVFFIKSKEAEPQDTPPISDTDVGGETSDDEGTSQNTEETTQTDFGYTIPTEQEEGTVTLINNRSTFAELSLSTKEGVKNYLIDTNSVVFDVKTNSVERVSTLTEKDKIQVLSSPNQQGVSNVSAILINNNEGVLYSPVMRVVRTEGSTYLLNNVTGTKYKVDKGTKVTNALTGRAYNELDLKEGDRLFIYEGKKVEAWEQTYEEDDVMPSWVTEPEEPTNYADDKEVPSNLKTVNVSELYVYPY